MIKKISDLKGLEDLRKKGLQRGSSTGFKSLDEFYSIKPGSFTIVQGPPGNGKSEFIFELLMAQAEKYGKRSILLTPESGNAEEIAMELISKYLRKNAYKTSGSNCTDVEFYGAVNWIDHHFAIADDDERSYSIQSLVEAVNEFEKGGDKYDYVMAEPWNELDHKEAILSNAGRQDLAIEDELSQLRRYCAKSKKHVFLSFHPSHQALEKDKETGITYYPMPKAREAAGGQATLRKAFCWMNIWRPILGLKDENGIPFQENELIIEIEKSKPKGVGKKGFLKLYFDWKKNRYYEYFDHSAKYAFDHEKTEDSGLRPSAKFNINEVITDVYGDAPF